MIRRAFLLGCRDGALAGAAMAVASAVAFGWDKLRDRRRATRYTGLS